MSDRAKLRAASIVLTIALASRASVTRADEAAEARVHYQRATSFFAVGEFARAGEEYQLAYTLKPDSALLFNAAQSYRLAGNNEKALILYKNYLNLYPRSRNTEDVRTQIDKLEQAIQAADQAKRAPPRGIVEATPGPSVAPTPAVTPAPVERKPVYRKWWFWTAIGAAVAVAVVVPVAVVYSQPSRPAWSDVADVGPGARMGLALGAHF